LKPELRDALLIAGAALALLPLLPDHPLPWLGGLNPHRIWSLAVLILALQGAGHLARRWLGAHRGLVLAGLAGGFASSTATIAAFGARARQEHAHLEAYAAAAVASTIATFLQFALITAAVHPPVLALLWPPLVAGCAAAAAVTAALFLRAHRAGQRDTPTGRAFGLWHALGLAFLLGAIGAALGFVERMLGAVAVQGAAALAGFADPHAAGASVLALAADDRISDAAAAWACLLALSTNTATRLVMACAAGGWGYGLRLSVGLLAGLAAAWAGAYGTLA
jgi:uncharacterized membrane protein (DUF4010 family)